MINLFYKLSVFILNQHQANLIAFPYTDVPIEKVNINAVFTQFVLAGDLFNIIGNIR